MINMVKPPHKYTVVEYKQQALHIINNLHTHNKIPIIVGGTNYYIEALLWDFLVDSKTFDEGWLVIFMGCLKLMLNNFSVSLKV